MQILKLNGHRSRPQTPALPQAPSAGPDLPEATTEAVPVAPPGTPVYTDVSKLRALAYSAISMDRLDDARVVLERALAQSPNDIEIVGDLASLALRQGDADAAVRLARCGLRLDPGHISCHVVLALGLVSLGDGAAARAALSALRDGEHAARLRAEQPAMADLIAAELGRLEAGGIAAPPGTPVHTLPLRARFDILVKLLYVLHRRGELPGWVSVDVPALYARHLRLRQPGQPQEASAGSERFDALIDTMGSRGYDASQPVRLSAADGLPVDGAHRMAAALAMGLPVSIETVEARGERWDLSWFQQHGFGHEACNVLLRTWARLRGEAACVSLLWAPAEAHWPQLEASLAGEMHLVSARTLELPRAAFEELVRDVCSLRSGPVAAQAVERRIELLRAWPARLRVLYTERRDEPDALEAPALEEALHAGLDAAVPAAWGVTLHMSGSADETRHLMDIVASEHNLAMLRRRGAMEPAFARQLVALHRAIGERGLSPEAVCVVGDGVLAALGLRPAASLEITVRSQERLSNLGLRARALGPQVGLAAAGYARSFGQPPQADDDTLIARPDLHFRVRGIRFAAPALVLARKQHDAREEDLRDLPLLAEWADIAR